VYQSVKRFQPIVILWLGFSERCRNCFYELVFALNRLRQNITQTYVLSSQVTVPFSDCIAARLELLAKPLGQVLITSCPARELKKITGDHLRAVAWFMAGDREAV